MVSQRFKNDQSDLNFITPKMFGKTEDPDSKENINKDKPHSKEDLPKTSQIN